MAADTFYSDLPGFSEFSATGDPQEFQPVPDDWMVLAADIVQSRQAIQNGRYKEVNMVGAAVIAAVLNRLGRERAPFVFGGDGAILLVPESDADAAKEALAGVVTLSRSVMELELRAAAIPVREIRALGGDFRVRKYRLSLGNHLAMVIGDGLAIADRILKDETASAPYAVRVSDAPLPLLDGLSCRWEPLQAQNGRIISLIIKPVNGSSLPLIAQGLTAALGYNPLEETDRTVLADDSRLRFKFPPVGQRLEVRLAHTRNKLRGWIKSSIENLLFVVSFVTRLPIGPFNPNRYMKELSLNTDHRKLGDSLQLVLDVSSSQLEDIKSFLEAAYQNGQAVYGIHISDTALMTCFVQNIGKGHHIHFVDGDGGGLSLAATDFKERQEKLISAKA